MRPLLLAAALLAAATARGAPAAQPGAAPPPDRAVAVLPAPRDKCPVCGMFVVKYPAWVAAVTFQDGGRAVFDGAKDLFRFLLDPGKYLTGRRRDDVAAITVTDYYELAQVDARAAFYVIGGDVLGPMGDELVPFGTRAGAAEFLADHRGKRIVRFDEVTPEQLRTLDD
jgi:nitrous oxide reductase accessory protein NosL